MKIRNNNVQTYKATKASRHSMRNFVIAILAFSLGVVLSNLVNFYVKQGSSSRQQQNDNQVLRQGRREYHDSSTPNQPKEGAYGTPKPTTSSVVDSSMVQSKVIRSTSGPLHLSRKRVNSTARTFTTEWTAPIAQSNGRHPSPAEVDKFECWSDRNSPVKGKLIVIAFGGFNKKRKGKALRWFKIMKEDPVIDELYSFTEDDLPAEFYEQFAHAKDHMAYWWTWKPYIIRNITETVANEGDVIVYMDADRVVMPRERDNFHYLACLVDRWDGKNYGGVIPYSRCSGFPESRFSSPELLYAMGMDLNTMAAHSRRLKQQYYAGVVTLKKTSRSVRFLTEWESLGKLPFTFSNNYTAILPRPDKGPVHHWKNDQSVFSLLCKRYKMTAWPIATHGQMHDDFTKTRVCLQELLDLGSYGYVFDNLPSNLMDPADWEFGSDLRPRD